MRTTVRSVSGWAGHSVRRPGVLAVLAVLAAAWPLGLAGCGGSSGDPVGSGGSDAGRPGLDAGAGLDAACTSDCAPTSDPGMPGSFATTTSSADLALADGTTIPLTLYLPAGAGPFPVVVFHHGFQLDPALYASYGSHLASWGYVVVMPKMPGGLIGGPTHRELAIDLGAVLDWLDGNAAEPSGPLGGVADASRIGLAGHSLGGKISLLTAAGDARVAAVFGVDPVDAAGGPGASSAVDYPSVTPELMDQITVPIALVGETTNATCTGFFCQPCAPAADNFQQYYDHADHPAVEIEVLGANHMSFLDDPACGLTCSACAAGSDDPDTTRLVTRRAMTAFFNVVLRDDGGYLGYLSGDEMAAEIAAGLVTVAHKNGL
jgi:dienelactone hydrolase